MTEGKTGTEPKKIPYFWACEFCAFECNKDSELKKHVDNAHLEDLWSFPCPNCDFKAQGPKYLREHICDSIQEKTEKITENEQKNTENEQKIEEKDETKSLDEAINEENTNSIGNYIFLILVRIRIPELILIKE